MLFGGEDLLGKVMGSRLVGGCGADGNRVTFDCRILTGAINLAQKTEKWNNDIQMSVGKGGELLLEIKSDHLF